MTALAAPAVEGRPSGRNRVQTLLPDAIFVAVLLACAALAVLTRNPLLAAAAIGVTSVAGAAWAATRTDPDDRAVIAVGTLITILIAVPLTRLSSPGPAILALTAGAALLLLTGLRRGIPRGTWLLAAFIGVLALATALSPDHLALLRFAPLVAATVPCFLLYGRLGDGQRRRVERVLLTLGATESLLAVAETFVLRTHLWGTGGRGTAGQERELLNPFVSALERAQGTLGHPLPLAILLTVCLALLFRRFPATPLAAKVPVAAVLLAGLALSGSRNALLAVAVILLFFSTRRLRSFQMVAGSLVLAFAAAATIMLGLVSGDARDDFVNSGSVTHRLGAYEAVPALLTEQPIVNALLGNGFASTARIFATGLLQDDGFAAVDNQWVSSLSQGGVVAVVLLVVLLGGALLKAGPGYRPALLALVYTAFIFDVYNWPSAAILMTLVAAAAWNRRLPRATGGTLEPSRG